MSVFDQIKTGLEEAIDYERGSLKARVTGRNQIDTEEYWVYTGRLCAIHGSQCENCGSLGGGTKSPGGRCLPLAGTDKG